MKAAIKQKEESCHMVKFGDVAQEAKGSTKDPIADGYERYVGLEHIDPQSLRLSRWGSIAEDKPTFTKTFKTGQILFGRRRAYLKKAAVPNFDGVCSGDIIVIDPKGKLLLPELLPFVIQSDIFFSWAIKHSAGGLSPRTKFKSLTGFEFPLPSLERQESMLEMLYKNEDAFYLVEQAEERAMDILKRIREQLLEGQNCKEFNLSDIVTFKGGAGFKEVYQGKKSGEFPFIKVSDMNSAENTKYINASENWIDNQEKEAMKASAFPAGTVVFAKVGAALFLNRRRILNRPTIIDNNMMAAIPSPKILTNYLYHFLCTIDFATFVRPGAVPSVNQSDLGAIKIRLPSLENQKKAIDALDGFEDVISSLNLKKKKNISLRNTLLKTLMAGANNDF